MTRNIQPFPELGFYALPGHVSSPTEFLTEIRDADALGLGAAWISERLNTKDIGILTGAAIAAAPNMATAAGLIANLPLRHPAITASYASSATLLSNNKFILGIGRGTKSLSDAAGLPHPTKKYVEDYVMLLRRFWAGEKIDYDGPVGKLNGMTLGVELETPPPIYMGAVGFKNCEWAGTFADGVLLNTFWSADATAKGVQIVRESAERAGRDPEKIKILSILATACDVPEELELQYIIRRLNTYLFFPQQWNATCTVNGWSPEIADMLVQQLKKIDGETKAGSIGDENTSRDLDDLRRMRDHWPQEWINASSAIGSPSACAQAIKDRFDAGADGVVLHASAPKHLQSLLQKWKEIRPSEKFRNLSEIPGRNIESTV